MKVVTPICLKPNILETARDIDTVTMKRLYLVACGCQRVPMTSRDSERCQSRNPDICAYANLKNC